MDKVSSKFDAFPSGPIQATALGDGALGDNHQAEVRLAYSNAVCFHAFWSYRQMVVARVNSEEINSDR